METVALHGLRVLDLSRILAGPTAAQMFGDFGADVIKVERPGSGDDARRMGGAALRGPGGETTDFSPMHVCANRNKRSVCVDIAKPEGADLVRRLAARADVLIENFKVGDLARHGLDYPSLSVLNPRLIYCSVTGFGQTGPRASQAGFDSVFQAMSGLMSTTGAADDTPQGGPMRVGVPITDFVGGLYAFGAILVALHHRDRHSGRGQQVDLALLDAAIAATSIAMAHHLASGARAQRCGNEQATVVPAQALRCADGAITVSAPTDSLFARLCASLGEPSMASDERFATHEARVHHRPALTARLSALVSSLPRATVLSALGAAGVPSAPVYEFDEVLADPQVAHRGVVATATHPVLGTMRLATNPVRLSESPACAPRAPPMLGEHTDEVLRTELGLTSDAIARLRRTAVI